MRSHLAEKESSAYEVVGENESFSKKGSSADTGNLLRRSLLLEGVFC